jgi:hypothetical protein
MKVLFPYRRRSFPGRCLETQVWPLAGLSSRPYRVAPALKTDASDSDFESGAWFRASCRRANLVRERRLQIKLKLFNNIVSFQLVTIFTAK